MVGRGQPTGTSSSLQVTGETVQSTKSLQEVLTRSRVDELARPVLDILGNHSCRLVAGRHRHRRLGPVEINFREWA